MTATQSAHAEKITHALSILNNAGLDNKAIATSTTVHAEKITHAVNALTNANLSDSTASKHTNTKWIVLGASIGGVILLAILILIALFLRGRRRRRAGAYANVGRGIDMRENDNSAPGGINPAQGAPPQPGMRGFLMPAWRAKKSKTKSQSETALRGPSMDLDLSSRRSSFDATAGAAHNPQGYERRGRDLISGASRSRDASGASRVSVDSRDRSRSHSRVPRVGREESVFREALGDDTSRDVFNAEKEMMPSESDSMLVGPKIAERNFESGYDNMDTSYGGMVWEAIRGVTGLERGR